MRISTVSFFTLRPRTLFGLETMVEFEVTLRQEQLKLFQLRQLEKGLAHGAPNFSTLANTHHRNVARPTSAPSVLSGRLKLSSKQPSVNMVLTA